MKIIHLFPTPNVYGLLSEGNQPDVLIRGGEKQIGIFRDHWVNLLCDSVMQQTSKFQMEIWQPDHHCDKVYSHTFENGVKHFLFPYGKATLNPEHGNEAPVLEPFFDYIDKQSQPFVVQLHEYSNEAVRNYLLDSRSAKYNNILHQYGGMTNRQHSRSGKNLLRRLRYYLKSIEDKKALKRVIHAVTMYAESTKELRCLYSGPISSNTMGIDENYWTPGSSKNAREFLKLPLKAQIILSASMLRPKKQIKELVEVFLSLQSKGFDNFYLIIAGGGDPQYESKVKKLAAPLIDAGKILFTGRVTDEQLRDYYRAADLFVLLSSGEGSPVSIMKAHACEVPVMTTDFGEAPEVCRKYNVGLVVPNKPEVWETKFSEYISGKLVVKKLGRETALRHYSWPNVANRFVELYDSLKKERI